MWCACNKQQYFLMEVTDIDVVCLQQTAILSCVIVTDIDVVCLQQTAILSCGSHIDVVCLLQTAILSCGSHVYRCGVPATNSNTFLHGLVLLNFDPIIECVFMCVCAWVRV